MIHDYSSSVAYLWSLLLQWLRYSIDFLDSIVITKGVTLWLLIITVAAVMIICDLIFFVNNDDDIGNRKDD